jgi:hypothetical protein
MPDLREAAVKRDDQFDDPFEPERDIVIAAYSTRCPECDQQIDEGDAIVQTDDFEWVHEACG